MNFLLLKTKNRLGGSAHGIELVLLNITFAVIEMWSAFYIPGTVATPVYHTWYMMSAMKVRFIRFSATMYTMSAFEVRLCCLNSHDVCYEVYRPDNVTAGDRRHVARLYA